MLIGRYSSKIGAKKRVAFPKKFREEMGANIIVTRGYEGCIVVVDQKRWEIITKEIVGGTFIDKKIRESGRFLLTNAYEVELDGQGRFVIPDSLCEFAGLDEKSRGEIDEVIFLGLTNWVEIWSVDRWQEHEEDTISNSEEVAQEIADIVSGKPNDN